MVPVYSATKAYNFSLSRAMSVAYSSKIDVLTVTPSNTRSQMNSGRYLFTIESDSHAKSVVNQLGWQSITYGNYVHAL